MARPLRIEFAGSWYHVMNRGAGKQKIFHNDNEYKLFLDLLNQIHNRYQIEIHAYCLMPNHYHLLIRTPLTNLSRAMRHLNGVYTQRYNQLQKSDGPLFRGRFKSIVVDKEHYFLKLSRYIHLNPVASGLTKKAEKYPWSSYAAYLNPDLSPRWLKQNDILEGFGARMQKQKYRIFVEEGIDRELDTFFKQLKRVPILGSEAFTKTITDKYLTDKSSTRELPELSQLNKLRLPNIDEIKLAVANNYRVDMSRINASTRTRGNEPRQAAIYLANKLTGQTLQTIANEFSNISYSGISKTVKRMEAKLAKNKKFADELAALEKTLMSKVKT